MVDKIEHMLEQGYVPTAEEVLDMLPELWVSTFPPQHPQGPEQWNGYEFTCEPVMPEQDSDVEEDTADMDRDDYYETDYVWDGGYEGGDERGMSYEGCTGYWDRSRTQPYRHINHFRRLLDSVQGINCALRELPPEVFELFDDDSNDDLDCLMADLVRNRLRKAKLARLYPYVPLIIHWVNGTKLPRFNPVQYELLVAMFQFCLDWFKRNKRQGRKNFLSYPFLLTRMCTVVNIDAQSVNSVLPKIKSSKSRRMSEEVWTELEQELCRFHRVVEYNKWGGCS